VIVRMLLLIKRIEAPFFLHYDCTDLSKLGFSILSRLLLENLNPACLGLRTGATIYLWHVDPSSARNCAALISTGYCSLTLQGLRLRFLELSRTLLSSLQQRYLGSMTSLLIKQREQSEGLVGQHAVGTRRLADYCSTLVEEQVG